MKFVEGHCTKTFKVHNTENVQGDSLVLFTFVLFIFILINSLMCM